MVKYVAKIGSFGLGANVVANEGNRRAWGLSGSYAEGNLDLVAYTCATPTRPTGARSRDIQELL